MSDPQFFASPEDLARWFAEHAGYVVRFTPRRVGSTWSEVNVRRVAALSEQGRMRPAEAALRADDAAWAFFTGQPPSYRRAAT